MAQAKQYRFFGYGNEDNYSGEQYNESNEPIPVSFNNLVNGNLFFQNGQSAKQLGIQTIPGVKFYLSGLENDYGIVIGKTGIYELNTEKLEMEIKHLAFAAESIEMINQNSNAYLIVDIIYS